MSVSFEKNRDQILSTWKEVLNDKCPTNWALYSYERQSNEICLVGKGDGGLEELAEEFNTAKIMYGLARVIDPNTGLPKFVFINWQGEGAPLTRKGICSNHVSDVSKFFKGANIHINARTEEDVEPDFILEKVLKASSSKFDFTDRSEVVENVAPVGSVYKRTRPNTEINPSEREKFWQKEAEEEARRVENEKKKMEEERKRLEQERKQREIQEAQKREEKLREKYRSIDKQREAVKNAENTAKIKEREQRTYWVKQQLQEIDKEKEEVSQRPEHLKKERKSEAEALISTRTINARAIFEQNTSVGQMSAFKGKSQVPLNHQEITSPAKEVAATTTNQAVQEKVSEVVTIAQTTPIVTEDIPFHESILKDIPEERTYEDPEEEDRYLREKLASSPLLLATGAGEGLKARALYDYQAADETEISFDPDDIITQIDQIDEGWWQGMAPDGTFGLFPANYVELIN